MNLLYCQILPYLYDISGCLRVETSLHIQYIFSSLSITRKRRCLSIRMTKTPLLSFVCLKGNRQFLLFFKKLQVEGVSHNFVPFIVRMKEIIYEIGAVHFVRLL